MKGIKNNYKIDTANILYDGLVCLFRSYRSITKLRWFRNQLNVA